MASVDLEDDLREYSGNRVSKLKKVSYVRIAWLSHLISHPSQLKADRERWVQEYKKVSDECVV